MAAATLTANLPGWQQMLAMAFALLAGLKWLSWRLAVAEGTATSLGRTCGYLLTWPGMDARAFLDVRRKAIPPQRREWARAAWTLLAGAALVWGLARELPPQWPLVTGWAGIAGFLLVLHFGLFDLVSLAWRSFGVDAGPIMRRPLAARTLGEFWGQRWNRAFRQVAYDGLYRPLVPRWARGRRSWPCLCFRPCCTSWSFRCRRMAATGCPPATSCSKPRAC